jgi:hypothetical protein
LRPLPWRSLQVGLSGEAVSRYVDEWIRRVTDITPMVETVRTLVDAGDFAAAEALRPRERVYLLDPQVAARVHLTPTPSA